MIYNAFSVPSPSHTTVGVFHCAIMGPNRVQITREITLFFGGKLTVITHHYENRGVKWHLS